MESLGETFVGDTLLDDIPLAAALETKPFGRLTSGCDNTERRLGNDTAGLGGSNAGGLVPWLGFFKSCTSETGRDGDDCGAKDELVSRSDIF